MAARAYAESGYNASSEASFIKGLGTWTVNQDSAKADMTRSQLLRIYRATLVRRHYSFAQGIPMYEATRQGLVDIVDEQINGEMPMFGKLRNG